MLGEKTNGAGFLMFYACYRSRFSSISQYGS